MTVLKQQVTALMQKNRREAGGHQYTVPSPELYPFQWLWDSCFHAIILTHIDLEAAKEEMYSVCAQPLINGLLPHIIYWSYGDATNWGREMRGDVINAAWGVVGTSAITQPPILALAAWRIYACDNDPAFLRKIYPAIRKHYRCLLEERTLEGSPLSFIINPDESGEDNSPRFDTAQSLPPLHTADENLERRIDRMRENVVCNFQAKSCMAKHFAIIDVPFNILLGESLGYLADIAEVLGESEDAFYFRASGEAILSAVKENLCIDGVCHAFDANSKELVDTNTWALFMPLYAGLLTAEEADNLVNTWLLDPERFWTDFPVPSTSLQESSFDPTEGFWRGPVWMAPNWFIYKGLKRYGYNDIATELKMKTETLLLQSGFREQYNPFTGEGLGANDFTWGGLVLDMD